MRAFARLDVPPLPLQTFLDLKAYLAESYPLVWEQLTVEDVSAHAANTQHRAGPEKELVAADPRHSVSGAC